VSTHVAVAETEINASTDEVWDALTDPEKIKEYMFGSEVVTDWTQGGSIVWKGEYDGNGYEDRGEILEIAPPRHLKVTHFSPSSGREDVPKNYHTILYDLEAVGEKTRVRLSQDNNASEEDAEHSRANWRKVLSGLKDVVERR
jgi:uncharacterized protein YndB with AHSA1/START domain